MPRASTSADETSYATRSAAIAAARSHRCQKCGATPIDPIDLVATQRFIGDPVRYMVGRLHCPNEIEHYS